MKKFFGKATGTPETKLPGKAPVSTPATSTVATGTAATSTPARAKYTELFQKLMGRVKK